MKKKLAILGTGNIGFALGSKLLAAGYQITFGTRKKPSKRIVELQKQFSENCFVSTNAEAITKAEIVFLAIPWNGSRNILDSSVNWDGKIVVDCINPINEDFSLAPIENHASTSEELAERLSGSKIIKAFNTLGVASILDSNFGQQPPALFYCSDHENAKSFLREIAPVFAADPIDVGELKMAGFLESLASLEIQLAVHQGLGDDIAFALLRR